MLQEEAVLHLSEYLREHAKSVVKPTAATEIITNVTWSYSNYCAYVFHKWHVIYIFREICLKSTSLKLSHISISKRMEVLEIVQMKMYILYIVVIMPYCQWTCIICSCLGESIFFSWTSFCRAENCCFSEITANGSDLYEDIVSVSDSFCAPS